MRDHERGSVAGGDDLLHALLTFLAEIAVADGEDLVKDYNVRLHHARNCKGDAAFHTRGQGAERVILKLAHIREIDDLVIFGVNKLL